MKENLLNSSARRGVIQIPGVPDESTWVKTTGVKDVIRNGREAIEFEGSTSIDYISIPSAGTIQPSYDNCRIKLTYEIDWTTLSGPNLVVLARWIQQIGQGDLLLFEPNNSNYGISYGLYSENNSQTFVKPSPISTINTVEYIYQHPSRKVYYNGVLGFDYTTNNKRQTNSNWYIGTYQDQNGNPLMPGLYASKCRWWLYSVTIERI